MGRIYFGKENDKTFVGELYNGLYTYPQDNLLLLMAGYSNGDFYFGGWENDKYNGIGALYKDKRLILGSFVDGENNGISLIDYGYGCFSFGLHKNFKKQQSIFNINKNGDWSYTPRYISDTPIGDGYLYINDNKTLYKTTFKHGFQTSRTPVCENVDLSFKFYSFIGEYFQSKIKAASSNNQGERKYTNESSYCYKDSFGIHKWKNGNQSLSFINDDDERNGFEIMYKDKKRTASFNIAKKSSSEIISTKTNLLYESKNNFWLLKNLEEDNKNLGTRFYFNEHGEAAVWNMEKNFGFLFYKDGQMKKITSISMIYKNKNDASFENNQSKEVNLNNHNLNRTLEELNSLIGLSKVKEEVNLLVSHSLITSLRKKSNLPVETFTHHLVFEGNPRTGKTTVARIIARLYYELGILPTDKIIEVNRSDLIGQHVGDTEAKTTEIINSALGGVLFIDEAYSLGGASIDDPRDFGKNVINVLINQMEQHRDNLIVIAAGYTEQMKDFLKMNPGLTSRFKTVIHFDDYSSDELLDIFKMMCLKGGYKYENENDIKLKEFFNSQIALGNIAQGNGRFIRNFYEKLICFQNDRLAHIFKRDLKVGKDELQTFNEHDILKTIEKFT